MTTFALWVTKIKPAGEQWVISGDYIYGDKDIMHFYYSGMILTISNTIRQTQNNSITYILKENDPNSFILDTNPNTKLPFLITNDLSLYLIFQGNIQFEISKEYQHLLSFRRSIKFGITSSKWFGILEARKEGFWRRKTTFYLRAYSSEVKAKVTEGPVNFPVYEIFAGKICKILEEI